MDREKHIGQWQELLTAGNSQAADALYRDEIFPAVRRHFATEYANRIETGILISLVGMSPEPLILTISALKPEKVIFVVSAESENYLDRIVEETQLLPSRFARFRIDSSTAEAVYEVIYKTYQQNRGKAIAIDITGGKKAMVGGAAQAAAMINAQLLYVDYAEYLPHLRKPKPFSEFLSVLADPLAVFGHMELRAIYHLYREGNFNVALQRMSDIERKIREPQKIQLLRTLVLAQQSWEQLQTDLALKKLIEARDVSSRLNVWVDLRPGIDQRIALLNIAMDAKQAVLNVVTMFGLAEVYASRQWFDFAVLLLYRSMEKALSDRLNGAYGISTDQAKFPPEILLEDFNATLGQIYGESANLYAGLPAKLGFMNCAVFLTLFNDEMLANINLKELNSQATQRNQGILAHGDRINTKKEYGQMKKLFEPLLNKYLSLHFRRTPIAELSALIQPMTITEFN
jgi:CRISPR-associated protein (TIGR02710 family)